MTFTELAEHKEFKRFWAYLQEKASDQDAWWLDGWLDTCLEQYKGTPVCQECGYKWRITKSIYSQTRNHVLEYREQCFNCGKVFSVKDNKPYLRKLLADGNVKAKDVAVLRQEVETPS